MPKNKERKECVVDIVHEEHDTKAEPVQISPDEMFWVDEPDPEFQNGERV